MTISPRFAAPAAVLAAVLALAGCGGSDSGSADEAAPGAATSGTPGSAPDGAATEPSNPDGPTAPPGASSTGTRSLPDGFPVDEIPVAQGDVIDGVPGDPGGPVAFSLLIRVSGGSPAAAMGRITAQLKEAGFTASPGVGTATTATSTFTNATYDVGVNVIKSDGKLTASYVVVRKKR